jgi:esterase/lipase superfamily enzyme
MQEIEITLRKDSSGGAHRSKIYGTRAAFDKRSRLILLVHGFNVSEDQAHDRQYQPLTKRLANLGVRWDIGEVYWPGDGRIPIIRNLQYPLLIKRANDCSKPFAEYLSECEAPNNMPCEIVLIAHSLGCRLILETLLALTDQLEITNRSAAITIIMMGAAVPVSLVKYDGRLSTGLSIVKKATVLYSRQDFVLSWLFPLGQVFDQDGRTDLEAVGLRGNPCNGLWHKRSEMPNYQHGYYWEREDAAREIAAILGVPVAKPLKSRSLPPQRQLPYRQDPTNRSAPKSRNLRP